MKKSSFLTIALLALPFEVRIALEQNGHDLFQKALVKEEKSNWGHRTLCKQL